jgi:hypothetical protein
MCTFRIHLGSPTGFESLPSPSYLLQTFLSNVLRSQLLTFSIFYIFFRTSSHLNVWSALAFSPFQLPKRYILVTCPTHHTNPLVLFVQLIIVSSSPFFRVIFVRTLTEFSRVSWEIHQQLQCALLLIMSILYSF